MSEPLRQPVFLKDLRQPFFLKELPSIAGDGPPIDVGHLARTTRGERCRQYLVLQLFDRQADVLLARMSKSSPAGVASLAHALARSARGSGAWRVAQAAEALERAVVENRELASALQTLDCVVVEARLAICALLRLKLSPLPPASLT